MLRNFNDNAEQGNDNDNAKQCKAILMLHNADAKQH